MDDTWKKNFHLTAEGAAALKALEDLNGVTIKVGWQSDGKMKTKDGASQPLFGKQRNANGSIEQSPATLAEIAMFNELGTSTIPARPFMKQAMENGLDELSDFVSTGLSKIAKSGKLEQFLNLVGVKLVDMVQTEIENGNFVPNAPSTIARKGSDHPLIDTATMKNSVGYQIVEGNENA